MWNDSSLLVISFEWLALAGYACMTSKQLVVICPLPGHWSPQLTVIGQLLPAFWALSLSLSLSSFMSFSQSHIILFFWFFFFSFLLWGLCFVIFSNKIYPCSQEDVHDEINSLFFKKGQWEFTFRLLLYSLQFQ